MKAEISFDFVMEDDMPFVEGTYRLDGGVWQVFTCWRARGGIWEIGVRKDVRWESGVTGINVVVADDAKLNKQVVVQTLSDVLGVTQWTEVRAPDSIMLR